MRITIVGAGFSGTSLAVQLARQLPAEHEICLVGDDRTFARGTAYGMARPEHLLNVRADDLGVDPQRPRDFADWLELSDGSSAGFMPREIYGDYLRHRLDQVAAKGSLQQVRENVVGLQRLQDGFRITLADGSDFRTDLAVLAIGALPPCVLPEIEPALANDARYIGRVWEPGALAGVGNDARVLILGSGLTMADVVTSLRHQGHDGPITAISRHGLVPRAHSRKPQAPVLPPALQNALQHGDVRQLLRALRAMAEVGGDWRPLVDGMRPRMQALWQRWDDAQQRRFLRHVRAWWEAHRHRIAPGVAGMLAREQEDGRLAVRAARLLHARLDHGVVRTVVRARGSDDSEIDAFDVLIRATGFETDVARTHHALLVHLREARLLTPDPHGLGIRTGADGGLLAHDGAAVPGLFALGPLQRGRLWEITAIPELRDEAHRLAVHLSELATQPRPAALPAAETRPRRRRAFA